MASALKRSFEDPWLECASEDFLKPIGLAVPSDEETRTWLPCFEQIMSQGHHASVAGVFVLSCCPRYATKYLLSIASRLHIGPANRIRLCPVDAETQTGIGTEMGTETNARMLMILASIPESSQRVLRVSQNIPHGVHKRSVATELFEFCFVALSSSETTETCSH